MPERYGLTTKHAGDSLRYATIITVAGLIVLVAAGYVLGFKEFRPDIGWVIFYAAISVPLQELLFRGFIQTHLAGIKRLGANGAIVLTSVAFALVHYENPMLVALTLPAALAWGYAFSKKPNIAGPVASHIVLGLFLFLFVL